MIKHSISIVFRISVAAFLLGGLLVVVLQAVGLIVGDGEFVETITDTLAPWTYGAAGVAGLLAFAMSYFPNPTDADEATPVDEVTPRPAAVAEQG
jgi:hypothetical protein